MKKDGLILEIGNGSGENGVGFQKRFPEISQQTSDPDLKHRKSMIFLIESEDLNKKMPKAVELDLEIFHSKGAGKLIRKTSFDIVWAIENW